MSPCGKKKPEDRVIESWDDQMQNRPSFLATVEEKRVSQWVIDRQHKG
jgi:hypothetical protein